MNDPLSHLAERLALLWRRYGRQTPLDGLLLTGAEAPSPIQHALYRPSLCVVAQGSKTSMLGDQTFTYAAGQCLLALIDVPVQSRITDAAPERPYLAFSLAIDPAMVAELLLEQAGTPGEGAGFSPLKTAAVASDLYDPLIRLMGLLERPHDLRVLAPLVRREIVWRLLNGPLAGNLRELGLGDGHGARIARATAWIRTHYAETIKVPDLAALTHMSVPSLHRHFKSVTTMTPVQFQKQVRLQEARRLLLADHDVATVGYTVGYESPSQFSRDYRRQFGAPPGRDGAAIRARFNPEATL